jgi:hypothetical protein
VELDAEGRVIARHAHDDLGWEVRATNRATKLSRPQRTEVSRYGLSKPDVPAHTSFRRYRTQEVAGSSPASSIETPAR